MSATEHGIVRNDANDGWYVLPIRSGESQKPFYDLVLGGPGASYAAAQAYNAQLRPFKNQIRHHRASPANKKNPSLPLGITLSVRNTLNKGGKGSQMIYSLRVSLFQNNKTKTVYVGTENTWIANFDSALKKAMRLREQARKSLLKSNQGIA